MGRKDSLAFLSSKSQNAKEVKLISDFTFPGMVFEDHCPRGLEFYSKFPSLLLAHQAMGAKTCR